MPHRHDQETQDSLRLLKAFKQVMDEAARERIIALTEALSRDERPEQRGENLRVIN